jgi:ribosomal protein L17
MPKNLFQKGNQYGKGDPLIAKMQEFRKTIHSAVSKKNVRDIMKAMIERAKKGDVKAAQLVLERVAGKVKDNTEISVTNGSSQELTIKLTSEDGTGIKNQSNTTTLP